MLSPVIGCVASIPVRGDKTVTIKTKPHRQINRNVGFGGLLPSFSILARKLYGLFNAQEVSYFVFKGGM